MLNGNVGAVKKFAQKFLEREKSTYYILFSDTIHAFILGLAAFQICRESEAHEASQWLKIGRKCTIDMQLWAEQGCVWNFQHKVSVVNKIAVFYPSQPSRTHSPTASYFLQYLLLKAEEFFSRGNLAAAKEAYISAIAYARKHRIINDEALACELTGKFLLNVGDLQSSLDYFRMAHEKYEHWGSPKKADLLFQFISAKFSGVLSRQIYTNSAGASADAVSRKRGDL
jgi:tetratricopeptide (TPR) repeat protein